MATEADATDIVQAPAQVTPPKSAPGNIPRKKKRTLDETEPDTEERRLKPKQDDESTPAGDTMKQSAATKEAEADVGERKQQEKTQTGPPPAWLGKRNYFFRKWGSSIRQQLQMDEVASFSITACDIADRMAKDLQRLQPDRSKRWKVIDGTACVGGNTIAFSSVFEHVYAIEMDDGRCAMLQNNLSVLGCTNVTTICGDFVSVFPNLPDCELLFLDPEWGGPEYMNADKVSLDVGGEPLSTICDRAFATRPGLQVVALKLPVNFDLDAFTAALKLRQSPQVIKYRKMIMVVLQRTMLGSRSA